MEQCQVTISGVLQGSVHGPFLFLINNIVLLVYRFLQEHTSHSICWSHFTTNYRKMMISHILDILSDWATKNFQSSYVQRHGCNTKEKLSESTNTDHLLPCNFSCIPVLLCHYISWSLLGWSHPCPEYKRKKLGLIYITFSASASPSGVLNPHSTITGRCGTPILLRIL